MSSSPHLIPLGQESNAIFWLVRDDSTLFCYLPQPCSYSSIFMGLFLPLAIDLPLRFYSCFILGVFNSLVTIGNRMTSEWKVFTSKFTAILLPPTSFLSQAIDSLHHLELLFYWKAGLG